MFNLYFIEYLQFEFQLIFKVQSLKENTFVGKSAGLCEKMKLGEPVGAGQGGTNWVAVGGTNRGVQHSAAHRY